MKVITYRIRLHEPVLAKGLEGDPNSGISYPFLPGAVLRGALIGQYLHTKSTGDFMQDETARRLFFDPDKTRFLNAYLLCHYNDIFYRALPTPLSWHFCKLEHRPSRISYDRNQSAESLPIHFDHAIEMVNVEAVSPEGDRDSWQQAKPPFCLTLPGQIAFAEVQRRVSVHTTRHRDYGRARVASGNDGDILNGAVYRYETIEAGQTFEAHILCQDKDVPTLVGLIEGEILLGGARTAGYGRVTLELVPSTEPDEAEYPAQNLDDWREAVPTGPDFTGVVITLLSDMLLRDEHGQPQSTVAELTRQLGFEPGDRQAAFAAYRPVGGFNRKWGLPTIQQTALKMGSVLVLHAPTAEQMSHLRALEKTGIGEQREDGFGRFALNWHTAASFTPIKLPPQKVEELSLKGTASEPIAQAIVNQLQRSQLDDLIREQAKRVADQSKMEMVSKTQLNRLRLQLQTAVHELVNQGETVADAKRTSLKAYKDKLLERNQTRRQFERARLEKQPFLEWLQSRLDAKTMPVSANMAYAIGEVTPQTDSEAVRLEYNLRLADLVLAHIVKQRRTVKISKEGKNE